MKHTRADDSENTSKDGWCFNDGPDNKREVGMTIKGGTPGRARIENNGGVYKKIPGLKRFIKTIIIVPGDVELFVVFQII